MYAARLRLGHEIEGILELGATSEYEFESELNLA